ncbi:hypothetical protein NLU13_5713 [Sarocladium strictum]|uniref:P-loop containing nucleoside triphosphate hydrolase protein n=1 Tax=Sarocladium strictum TaxID=5046 RepID=A0AA39GI11_SARSR|nr:hypothetical protein NLU13_5713 [Sarocladium strictum]
MAATTPHAAPTEVRIRVIGGSTTGKTVLIRHHVLGLYSDEYDPTDGSYRALKLVQGKSIVFDLEDFRLDSCSNSAFVDQVILQDADAVITVIEPTRPTATDELERVWSHSLDPAFKERRDTKRLVEVVVVLWWEDEMSGDGQDTQEWREGMDRGRRMAERAGGAHVLPVKARSGQGVAEAFDAVAMKVMEMRAAKAAEGATGDQHAAP